VFIISSLFMTWMVAERFPRTLREWRAIVSGASGGPGWNPRERGDAIIALVSQQPG
jgi:hypothetical protein